MPAVDGSGVVVEESGPEPQLAERLLRALPQWFGIESSIVEYVADAARLPTLVARPSPGADPVGLVLLNRHFGETSEIHLIAVAPQWHRHGIGRALLAAAERIARGAGARLLEVKTLGESRPDVNYAATRAFYLANGFLPLEELLDYWPDNPCLILVKPLSAAS